MRLTRPLCKINVYHVLGCQNDIFFEKYSPKPPSAVCNQIDLWKILRLKKKITKTDTLHATYGLFDYLFICLFVFVFFLR